MMRDFLQRVTGFIFRILARIETVGMENVPPAGACILTANHLHILDAPLIFALVKRRDLSALVAKKYQSSLIISWLVKWVNGIWINRQEADSAAMRLTQAHLRRGGMLGIAPEGTRSSTGGLIPAKTGVAFIADRLQTPIIPVAIIGTYKAEEKLRRLRRLDLKLVVGKPFTLPPLPRVGRDEQMKRNTDEIMCRIAAMLPPEHRGVYVNHPRLRELLG